MFFHSFTFILLFLPLTWIAYFVANRWKDAAGKLVLITASLIFYLEAGWFSWLLLLISVFANYAIAKRFLNPNNRSSISTRHKRLCLALPIVLNLTLLYYFKYLTFTSEILSSLLSVEWHWSAPLLPLGISFFTFQQIAFLVSFSQGKLGSVGMLDYLTYILYFPKLLMGPLAEPESFFSQLHDASRKRLQWDSLARGCQSFAYGLFQKLVLADSFASAVQWGFQNPSLPTAMDWILIMLFYTLQIYFDFAGYTDMARGVSCMFNLDLPSNFHLPYRALSVQDFWKRWHQSLTQFFRQYVYIPLGGNRKGPVRTACHILIIFLISGFWHGANWTFLLWGLIYGLLMVWDRFESPFLTRVFPPVRWILTFVCIQLLWLLFRSDSISQWYQILKTLSGLQNLNVSSGLFQSLSLPEADLLYRLPVLHKLSVHIRGLWTAVFTLFALGLCLLPNESEDSLHPVTPHSLFLSILAFVWAFLCLGRESVFVYFNF